MSFLNKLYKKKKSEEIEEVKDIFNNAPLKINQKMDIEEELNDPEQEKILQDLLDDQKDNEDNNENQENPFVNEELSLQQKKERDERTVFIGNVPLDATKKDIVKMFKKVGKIENIRERSVPVKQSKDLPIKARVILKKHVEENKDNQVKNCYILFANKEDAEKALEKNGAEFKNNFLRVDLATKKELDFTKTLFVGNLHFDTTENQLREHFKNCGKIVNVRIIRDKETFKGKGFGYVQFRNIDEFKKGLEMKGSKLLKREIRVKKAVPQQRLEKKKQKKEEKMKQNQEFAQRRIKDKMKDKLKQNNNDDDDEDDGQNNKNNRNNKQQKRRRNSGDLKSMDKKQLEQFGENQMENLEDVDIKNNLTMAPRLIRKKIKKMTKKGDDADKQFQKIQKMQQNFHENNDKNIFNGTQGLKDRKKNRMQRHLANKKKVKKQVINQ